MILAQLFHTRYNLHKRAYQHKTVGSVELMIAEAMMLANDHMRFSGRGGSRLRMSDCCTDLHAYWKLGEYILKLIEFSDQEEMRPAREIIERLRQRKLFPFVGERLLQPELNKSLGGDHVVKEEILALLRETVGPDVVPDDDVIPKEVKIGYGKGKRVNPVTQLTTFYEPRKVDSSDGFREVNDWVLGDVPADSVSRLLPHEFEERYIRVYCRHKSQKAVVRQAFDKVTRLATTVITQSHCLTCCVAVV